MCIRRNIEYRTPASVYCLLNMNVIIIMEAQIHVKPTRRMYN